MAKAVRKSRDGEAYNTKVRGRKAPTDLTDPQKAIAERTGRPIDLIPSGTMTRSEYWRLIRGEDPPEEGDKE